jgi:amino acid adenylation domain-containing protein
MQHPGAHATLIELLRSRTALHPEKRAYTFLLDGDLEEVQLSYSDLDRRAQAIGALLQHHGATGERVLLLYPPGLDYLAAFFGCLYAGAIAVPAYPPNPARFERTLPRLRTIVGDARPSIALTTTPILAVADRLAAQAPEFGPVQWHATDTLADELAADWREPAIDGATLAFLQYTSGSTATPKGVMLTHRNLLHNSSLIQQGFRTTPESRGVFWLPFYHDMGLIGGLIQPIYCGGTSMLMSPVNFLQRPLRWLQAISRFQATISGGPNFAYDLCVRKITPEQREQLDLSSWQVAFNGAEPIRADTLNRFAEAFSPCGFRREAFYPCYGLAEATLLVSGVAPEAAPLLGAFDASALERRQVVERVDDEQSRTLVGSGQPLQSLAIVDPETMIPCKPGRIGEIWVASASVAQGYWNQAAESERSFGARMAGDPEAGFFLRTGDLGFLHDGELFVTGRIKDLIIIRGRNHYPQDIELTVERSHPALRSDSGAAVAVEVDGEERLVIVQEVERQHRGSDMQAVIGAIRQAVAEQHELNVYAVTLLKPGSIPKTSSGKIQRHACRAGFLNGTLETIASSRHAEPASAVAVELTREALLAVPAEERQPLLAAYLHGQIARALQVDPAQIRREQPISALGLDSLMAVELQHALETELGVVVSMVSFLQDQTVDQLAADILDTLDTTDTAQPTTTDELSADVYPLSAGQHALWFLYQLTPDSAAYNIASAVRIRGSLDRPALRRSFQRLLERHPALRASFHMRDGEPVQQIQADAQIAFMEHDASGWSETERQSWLQEAAQQPFDLEHGPLLRVALLACSAEEHLLLVTVHHIVSDLWSLVVLTHELSQIYPAECAGTSTPLPPPPRYSDYVRWHAELLAGPQGERLANYWLHQLADAPTVLELPTDRPRPALQSDNGAVHTFALDAALTRKLRTMAETRNTTLYTVLLAAFQALLSRYSGQHEFLIGTPTAGRSRAEFTNVVGYFTNALVLRADLSARPSFSELIERTRQTSLDAFAHQDYPFVSLVERMELERDLSRSPLFQVMFALQKAHIREQADLTAFALGESGSQIRVGGLLWESLPLAQRIAQFDLSLAMGETASGLAATLEYNTDLFDPASVERMAQHLHTILEAVVVDPGQAVDDLPLLSQAERQQLAEWNATTADLPAGATVHHLFAAQARRTPQAAAVIYGDTQLSYGDLNTRADRLAARLRTMGVGAETLIGICADRSVEMMVGILAILKAGGAYVPLDPTYPQERIAFVLKQTGAAILLTQTTLREELAQHPARLICLDADDDAGIELRDYGEPAVAAENAACVIYTSGSTGQPKGVVLTHSGIVNLIQSFVRSYEPGAADRMLPLTSLASASFIGEIFPLLCAGGALVLPNSIEVLDFEALHDLIVRRQVTMLSAVPSLIARLNARAGDLPGLRLILSGGEALAHGDIDQLAQTTTISNGYGLTETTVCSTFQHVDPRQPNNGSYIPIGRPVINTQIHILDDRLHPVPVGVPGELFIGGAGLARGYFNDPALTAELFIPNPFGVGRLYRSGDRARWLPGGSVEFLGRLDQQVKLRGFRIELGEIESLLSTHPLVHEAVVIAREDVPGDKRLVAYLVLRQSEDAEAEAPASLLAAFLRERLPAHMVPSAFVILDALPLTPNGKLDLRALPRPSGDRNQTTAAYLAPRSEAEQRIAAVWREALKLERVGIHDNFFDLGGHSLLLVQVHSRLRESYPELALIDLFRYPTVSALAAYLSPAQAAAGPAELQRIHQQQAARERRAENSEALHGIAIVGMAGRFPGANTIDQLWHNLCAGVESISFFSDEELIEAGVDPELIQRPNYVRARGALGDAEYFDAAFFGHSPHVAALMDPQHRLFLECAWTALEHAGYDSERYNGRIGVFAGESMNTYLLNNVFSHMQMVASVDSLQASIGNDKDSLTTEVAYKLNLTGPSLTIQTASSTSLVAVHVACQSLLNYECDMGLAGGVSIHFPEKAGYLYHEGGATSPDGHCRAFDARSNGFVNGHGAGIVVLKRLADALEDGDTIYGVIRGSAVNNDGAVKVSYMAPSVDGQAQVITMAQAAAGVEPESISYVEAHGTGTKLGDPIEIAALTQAFRARTSKRNYCAIGSIKPNIGHLDTAAGVAGLIKAALALHHGQIPASLHYTAPNPQIDFANSPFYVNTELTEWRSNGTPRRAGVSSFGMGGTNAHAVVEEAPQLPPSDAARPWQLLTLSAKSASALDQQTAELAAHLAQHPDLNLADVAYTLQLGRRPFNHRRTLVCRDLDDAAQVLATSDPERLLSSYQQPGERPVVFMFSGQGAQYPGMAAEIYRDEPIFRQALDRCAERLLPLMDADIRSIIFDTTGEQEAMLEQTRYAQPALFAVEYALAQLWLSWGVRPSAMIGHSVGEYVAATLAGVFALEDALKLIAARGRMMQALPPGAMLAVPLPEAEVRSLLHSESTRQLSLAAVNGPAVCVLSGPIEAVNQLERQLVGRGLNCRRLHTSHAFHSAMMEPILSPFAELLRGMTLHPPQMPFISNLSGTWISPEQATDPSYWAAHLRQAVRFADGLGELLRDPQTVLLEIGPGQTLTTLARQHPARTSSQTVLNSLRHPRDTQADRAFLLGTLAKLWLASVTIDAQQLYAGERRRRIALPTYPFERQRFWLEPIKLAAASVSEPTQLQKRAELSEWFYLPFWKPTLPPAKPTSDAAPLRWLLFADEFGISAELARHLEHGGHELIVVRPGDAFDRPDQRLYVVNPGARLDYDLLLADLSQQALLPDRIVHAWSISPAAGDHGSSAATFAAAQQRGFHSLLSLAQALGAQTTTQPVHIVALSSGMQCIAGERAVSAEKATLLGLCKVIPQEYPHISCQSVDLELPEAGDWRAGRLAGLLAAECLRPAPGAVLAYRDGRRWEQTFEQTPLQPGSSAIRPGGVYLITGGFGGIGLALARHLARTAQAKLALLARTPLPPREDWEDWLQSEDGRHDELRRRIRSVQELEALGAEVLVFAADVTQPAQLRAALAQIDARFGALHGLIHAAGLVNKSFFQVLQETDQAACEQHFQAKAYGAIALEAALDGRQLDFCMLLSSLSAVLGGLGFGAYAAANCFMDAFVQQHNQRSAVPWISVNWDAWEMTEAQREGLTSQEQSAAFAMTAPEGIDAFERILSAGPLPQMIVSTGDLHARINRWIELEQLREEQAAAPAEPASYHPRPLLPNPYIAPRNATEQAIAELWQATLGVQQVGIHDNFFDLGGNSLSGITLIGRLKERFQVQIPTVSLYEGPTVSALAKLIDQDESEQTTYEHSRSRGERRREKRRGRQRDRNQEGVGDETDD